ncbi:MAG: Cas10/Cmr2 second palm domain-containing protein [Actinomycetales bacterium]
MVGRREIRNHLATVCADGNAVGAFTTAQATAYNGVDAAAIAGFENLRSQTPGTLDHCTRDALHQAMLRVSTGGQPIIPVMPHFVGGDDVLVSVPASIAWEFAYHLATYFADDMHRKFTDLLDGVERGTDDTAAHEAVTGLRETLDRISLGVGICFAHDSYPFSDSRERAFDAMKQAKKRVKGRQSAVSWIDLTAESSLPPRRHLDADGWRQLRDHDDPVLNLTASARDEVGAITRTPNARPDAIALQIRSWARRTQKTLPGCFDPNLKGPPERPEEQIEWLEDRLSLARWWPVSSTPHNQEATS